MASARDDGRGLPRFRVIEGGRVDIACSCCGFETDDEQVMNMHLTQVVLVADPAHIRLIEVVK